MSAASAATTATVPAATATEGEESMESAVRRALGEVVARVERAGVGAGRVRMPRLVAVSKTKPAEMLRVAYEAGQRHFGENYVHEIVEKAPLLPPDVRWHFIGTLQSNKVKELIQVPNLWMIEGVGSVRLAKEIEKRWPSAAEKINVLVQVNTSLEETKSGVEPGKECIDLVQFIVSECPKLRFMGLMTIGKSGDESCFDCLVQCKKDIYEQLKSIPLKSDDFELSMGMSADFELAIAKGATNVRVGSSIFGHREYPAKKLTTPPKPSETTKTTTTLTPAQTATSSATTKPKSEDDKKPPSPKTT